MAKDLVCDREVDEKETRFLSEYGNDRYYFCSKECKQKFDDHPDRVISEARHRQGL